MKTFKQKLLEHFNLTEEDFAHLTQAPSLDHLPSFERFLDLPKIKDRINKAIKNNEKIAVYGDYDCDGVMATSIVVETFKKLKYPITYRLPSRYQDGYGLTVDAVEKFATQDIKLIITVDNGISQIAAIDRASELGIDVIVTDHHELLGDLPKAYALMHPVLSNYGEVVACGAYVALMLSRALLDHYDPYLVSLAGIATISDMMLLHAYNREVVRLALQYINQNQYPSIVKLAETNDINENVIAMKVAPKINAIGRMTTGSELNVLVEYLTTDSLSRINDIYAWIYDINQARKETMKEATLNLDNEVDQNQAALVMITNENEGMLGLIASRLVNTYERPSIVFTYEHNDKTLLKGSARSRKGFNIGKAFQELAPLMVKFGGHELAGGCTIKVDQFEAFKEAFIKLAETYTFATQVEKVIDIDISELNHQNYGILRQISPFGQGFEAPLFRISDYPTSEITYSRDGKHIIKALTSNVKLVGFNVDREYIDTLNRVTFIGDLSITEFRNFKDLNYNIRKFY